MAKPDIPPRLLARFRRILGAYHSEVEELMRVLEALEASGLQTFSVKQVKRTHDLLERHLEQLDSGAFDARSVAKLVVQLENQSLRAYSPETAFERARGRAVTQMDTVQKRWSQLHDLVFESDLDVPILDVDAERELSTSEPYDDD